ncbi:MAG TPA: phosphoribosyltransferase family protein [Verrucomicrobiae bacterium]|nr:phosphoribosyltransferase family protein [Verrucomicrobiae bacterium]
MPFASRQDAGEKLGRRLLEEGLEVDLVVGLPRGGVIVAAEVAHLLRCPLDVLVVRKIGHPLHREFAVGAMAEGDVVLLDEGSIGAGSGTRARLEQVIKEEKERLRQYQIKFHETKGMDFRDRTVLLADDGLATGATMEAAALSTRKQGARRTIVAVPVASTSAVRRLRKVADEVIALIVDSSFEAVGVYYESFSQTTDEEVLSLLRAEHANH